MVRLGIYKLSRKEAMVQQNREKISKWFSNYRGSTDFEVIRSQARIIIYLISLLRKCWMASKTVSKAGEGRINRIV